MITRKTGIIIVCFLCAVLFSGSIFRNAEIYTMNGEPLIDLDALIHSTETGQEGSSNKGEEVTPVPAPQNGEKDPSSDPFHHDPVKTDGRTEIEVYNNEIRCGGYAYYYFRDIDSMKANALASFDEFLMKQKGKEVVIIDKYAEAHAYAFIKDYVSSKSDGSFEVRFEPDYGADWGVSR